MKLALPFAALTSTLFIATTTYAQPNTITSGIYQDVPVAYDAATKIVSGYMHSMSKDKKSACLFYFEGTLNDGKANISSYFPEKKPQPIAGTLTAENKAISISLTEEHYGCDKVMKFTNPLPTQLTLSTPHPTWQTIRVVYTEKAFMYEQADIKSKKPYFLRLGDTVATTEKQGDWYRVEYVSPTGILQGYMQASDLLTLSK
jgi:hypothetical protein